MPTVAPGSKILVTGANGFIALSVIQALLDDGFSVRGSVRSSNKQAQIQKDFDSYGDRVEWIVVEDITKEGAFDEAVNGISGIEHLASPLTSQTDDPDDYIVPAVQGTLNILKSAAKAGLQLKRVVITSSILAILSTPRNTPVFDESNWANEVVNTVKEQGKKSTSDMKYRASKTLAEKAAWEFYSEHKAQLSWDLVALNPPLVLGAPLKQVKAPQDLNQSMAAWFKMVFTDIPEAALKSTHAFVHIKDAATAHVLSLTKEGAGGNRIILSAATSTWQDLRNLIYNLKPEYYNQGILPRGNPTMETAVTHTYNNERSKQILGLVYRSYADVATDILSDFEARGWLDANYARPSGVGGRM